MYAKLLFWVTLFSITAFSVLGLWYLANPQFWNDRGYTGENANSTADAGQRMTAEPVEISPLSGPVSDNSMVPSRIPIRDSITDSFTDSTRAFKEGPVSSSCVRTPVSELTIASRSSIYRWTDSNDLVHFSDTPPLAGTAEIYDPQTPARMDYFDLAIDYQGLTDVPFFRNRLTVNATGIYKILSELLDISLLRKVELNLVVLPDRNSYHLYALNNVGDRKDNTGGYYSSGNNTAVTYRYAEDEMTLAVARHEAVHVILYGMLGITPMWLNEGLAEYFEQLSISSQYSRIDSNERWLAMARAAVDGGYPARFRDFLSLSNKQWNAEFVESNYALAGSFVYFLMESRQGRTALSAIMGELAKNYCRSVNSVGIFEQRYPGGLVQLRRDFYDWLNDSRQKRPHMH